MNDLTKNQGTDLSRYQEISNEFLYYGAGSDISMQYISDIHILHHIPFFDNSLKKTINLLAKSLYQSYENQFGRSIWHKGSRLTIFAGDISSDRLVTVMFMKRFMQWAIFQQYKYFKSELISIKALTEQRFKYSNEIAKLKSEINLYLDFNKVIVPRGDILSVEKYLSGSYYKKRKLPAFVAPKILRLCKILSYQDRLNRRIDFLCEKYNVPDISEIKLSLSDFKVEYGTDNPVFFILGNHEYIGFEDVDEAVNFYKKALTRYGVSVIQNEFVETEDYVLYGGSGFAKYDDFYNADNLQCCNKMLGNREYEIEQTALFEKGYSLAQSIAVSKGKCFICVSHYPMHSCLHHFDRETIYFTGHTHHNEYCKNASKVLYANNQIGYHNDGKFNGEIAFKVASTGKVTNPFADFDDGYFEIAPAKYIRFSQYINEPIGEGKLIYKRCENGKLYLLKTNGYYGFFIVSKSGISIVNGGKTKKLTTSTNIKWIYENFSIVVGKYLKALAPLRELQKSISENLINLGLDGNIHGLIVDIDYYNHIMLNPYDGTVTFYFSPTFGTIRKFESFHQQLEYMSTDEYIRIGSIHSSFTHEKLKEQNCYRLQMYDKLCEQTTSLALRDTLLERNEIIDEVMSDEFITVSRSQGAYGMSRAITPLQRLFTGHVLREFDLTLTESDNNQLSYRVKSYVGRVYSDLISFDNYMVIEDDMKDFITIVNLSTGVKSRITLQKLRAKFNGSASNKKALWKTYSIEETREKFTQYLNKYLPALGVQNDK